jgi:hypothetical protein
VLLTFLLTGTAYSEPQANKPYKVCPSVVTAKDTPCRVVGPTSSIVQRDVVREDPKDKEITELKDRVKQLEEMVRVLQSK